jgi:hypothetical protein
MATLSERNQGEGKKETCGGYGSDRGRKIGVQCSKAEEGKRRPGADAQALGRLGFQAATRPRDGEERPRVGPARHRE